MSGFLEGVAFHRSGKPRGWLRRILAGRGKEVRPLFWRVVYKKNGMIRPRFETWMRADSDGRLAGLSASKFEIDNDPRERARRIQAVLSGPPSLEDMVAKYVSAWTPATLQAAEEVRTSIAKGRTTARPLVVSVGHDNYLTITGGVQLCIQREQQRAADYGFDYLNVHPWHPLPRLSHVEDDPDPAMSMVLNGKPIGVCSMSTLVDVLAEVREASGPIRLVLHQLLGHQPELIATLAERVANGECHFWLHDFFSICPSFTLQRNSRVFCGAPELSSNACMICLFGDERRAHAERIQDMFRRLKVHVVAPSDVTLKLWSSRSGLPHASAVVAPHVTLDWHEGADASDGDDPGRGVKVALLGLPLPHKGGLVFEQLAERFTRDNRYRFIILGRESLPDKSIGHVEVHTTADKQNAMTEAVAAEAVDLVLHWASWPETFSLTTFEALAGGAFILTNSGSGNVAATVERTGFGKVLTDEEALVEFFECGDAAALAADARRHRARHRVTRTTSDMTLPLLRAEA